MFLAKIRFASAVCGSGKTHQIVNRACDIARRGDNVLIVQPTKQLIDKTVEQQLLNQPNPPQHEIFHGDRYPGRVAKELMDWLKTFGSSGGHVVFITHQLFPHIPYFPDKRAWHVFIDEAPQVHDHHHLTIPHSHSLLTDHLGLDPYNAVYSRLVCTNAAAITSIAQNKDKDQIFEVLSQAARDAKNPNWECYVNAEKFNRLLRGEVQELDIYTVLSPTLVHGFRSVLIASANFQDTVLYHLWKHRGVKFAEDVEFTRSLRFGLHATEASVKILYGIGEPWSRQRQHDKWVECENQSTLELIAKSATKVLGETPFVWQANRSDTGALRPLFGENVELPHLPHGLNDYSTVNNIVLLTASNPTPDQYRFLRNQGMDGEQVRRAVYYQNAYQTVLRTSIRDPNNSEPKLIVVPDRPLAEHLQELFPGSAVERLPTGIPTSAHQAKIGRPRKHQSDPERKAQHRQKARLESMRSLLHLGHSGPYVDGKTLYVQNRRDETPIESLSEFRPLGSHYYGTIFANKHTTTGLHVIGTNTDEFIGWLEHLSHREIPGKEANQLIAPAVFDPSRDPTTSRGLQNIVHVHHLWLDFENGDLRPEELPKLFPNIRMVVTNSYHHHTLKPRFHVFVPVRQPLTPDAYELLWDLIADKIEHAGYDVQKSGKQKQATSNFLKSGLDRGKRTPSSLFYLPCQAEDPSQSFFTDYRDDGRAILDAEVWFGNSVVPFRQPPPEAHTWPTEPHGELNQTLVDSATAEWRQSHLHHGEGNDRFWGYAVKLRTARMKFPEIEATPREEAQFARHPDQRRAQISSIMTSLRQSRQKAG